MTEASESEYFDPGSARVFKVSKDTHPRVLGATIATVLFTDVHSLVVIAVGAAAVNQAVKAIAVARWHLNKAGRDCVFVPQFESMEDDMTGMRLLVEERLAAPQGEPL
jgi:stage V sporulation protein S